MVRLIAHVHPESTITRSFPPDERNASSDAPTRVPSRARVHGTGSIRNGGSTTCTTAEAIAEAGRTTVNSSIWPGRSYRAAPPARPTMARSRTVSLTLVKLSDERSGSTVAVHPSNVAGAASRPEVSSRQAWGLRGSTQRSSKRVMRSRSSSSWMDVSRSEARRVNEPDSTARPLVALMVIVSGFSIASGALESSADAGSVTSSASAEVTKYCAIWGSDSSTSVSESRERRR